MTKVVELQEYTPIESQGNLVICGTIGSELKVFNIDKDEKKKAREIILPEIGGGFKWGYYEIFLSDSNDFHGIAFACGNKAKCRCFINSDGIVFSHEGDYIFDSICFNKRYNQVRIHKERKEIVLDKNGKILYIIDRRNQELTIFSEYGQYLEKFTGIEKLDDQSKFCAENGHGMYAILFKAKDNKNYKYCNFYSY